jgi:hypothetical protein
MLTRIALAVSIFCTIFPAAAFAQGFGQGDKDLLLSGFGVSSDGLDSTTLSASGSLGYFFTDRLEGSVRQDVSFVDVEDGDSAWAATTRVAADYYFDVGAYWPFVGVNLGLIYGDDVEDSWVFGPEVGLKYFVNSTTYIVGMIGVEWLSDEGGDDDLYDDARWVYALGIGFRW